MIDTQKILYILPDLAYLAEFLPGKQPNTFTVQSFKQFNGKLMDAHKLIFHNIEKLAKRVQEKVVEGELAVVLADEIFTNTIISVEKKTEAEVKDHLQEEVIPSLHITRESHLIETYILSEYKGVFKVQLSTVQHSALAPLTQAFADQKVKINKIYPLSWTLKSIISLEPSASLVEMGNNLFLAKHYIGVDQPMVDTVENLDRFVEAIKTLKGAEPNMQTIYLLSSKEVEEQLKEKLGELIPVQQVAQEGGSDPNLPGYIEKAMSLAMRTISIDEFEIPEFKPTDVKVSEEILAELNQASELEEDLEEEVAQTEGSVLLPKPGEKQAEIVEPETEESEISDEVEDSTVETEVEVIDSEIEKKESSDAEFSNVIDDADEKDQPDETVVDSAEMPTIETSSETSSRFYKPAEEPEKTTESKETPVVTTVVPAEKEPSEIEQDDNLLAVDLSQFSSKSKTSELPATHIVPTKEKTAMKQTIKNDDGTGNLFKVILVGFGTIVLTVAIGVTIGFSVFKLFQPGSTRTSIPEEPEIQVEEPEPVEEPSPTPMPEADRESYSIKVVNATTKAGYAGQFANSLKEKGYAKVEAKNAVDDYEPGYYLLMTERDDVLLTTLEQDLEVELSFSPEIVTEDPQEQFDAVLVLAE